MVTGIRDPRRTPGGEELMTWKGEQSDERASKRRFVLSMPVVLLAASFAFLVGVNLFDLGKTIDLLAQLVFYGACAFTAGRLVIGHKRGV